MIVVSSWCHGANCVCDCEDFIGDTSLSDDTRKWVDSYYGTSTKAVCYGTSIIAWQAEMML
eukprot:3420039-Amphidinium_carterae.2